MAAVHKIHFGHDDDHRRQGAQPAEGRRDGPDRDTLPYRIEVWDETGAHVERLLAMTTYPSLAYAVYYAAVREYFGRDVTVTCKGSVLSRWRARGS